MSTKWPCCKRKEREQMTRDVRREREMVKEDRDQNKNIRMNISAKRKWVMDKHMTWNSTNAKEIMCNNVWPWKMSQSPLVIFDTKFKQASSWIWLVGRFWFILYEQQLQVLQFKSQVYIKAFGLLLYGFHSNSWLYGGVVVTDGKVMWLKRNETLWGVLICCSRRMLISDPLLTY